jgi:hypothetical protein
MQNGVLTRTTEAAGAESNIRAIVIAIQTFWRWEGEVSFDGPRLGAVLVSAGVPTDALTGAD